MRTEPVSGETTTIEQTIGHRFQDPSLLEEALTHRSYAQESPGGRHNERLEFLGDAILGFLVSEALADRFPAYSEGQLTKLKAYLVSATNLVRVARQLGLGASLRLGRGEEMSGGREKKALLADSLEALIAAVYLDAGVRTARRVVREIILTPEALAAADDNLEIDNFKSALQELLQREKRPAPRYRVLEESGPPHRRTFTVELRVGNEFVTSAEGSSKKSAEQLAAQMALEHFQHLKTVSEAGEPEIVET